MSSGWVDRHGLPEPAAKGKAAEGKRRRQALALGAASNRPATVIIRFLVMGSYRI